MINSLTPQIEVQCACGKHYCNLNQCPHCSRPNKRKGSYICVLCKQAKTSNECAHHCPHGISCRFTTNAAGKVLDWQSNGCLDCDKARKLTTTPS